MLSDAINGTFIRAIVVRSILLLVVALPANANDAESDTTIQPPSARSDCPVISVAQKRVDVGDVASLSEQEISIPFSNTGTAPLIIEAIQASCGCMVTGPEKMRLEPGDESEIKVRWDVKGKVGPIGYHVLIRSNSCEAPEFRIEITGRVYPEIEVTPDILLFGDIQEGGDRTDITKKIRIHRVGDIAKEARITLASTSEYINLENLGSELEI